MCEHAAPSIASALLTPTEFANFNPESPQPTVILNLTARINLHFHDKISDVSGVRFLICANFNCQVFTGQNGDGIQPMTGRL